MESACLFVRMCNVMLDGSVSMAGVSRLLGIARRRVSVGLMRSVILTDVSISVRLRTVRLEQSVKEPVVFPRTNVSAIRNARAAESAEMANALISVPLCSARPVQTVMLAVVSPSRVTASRIANARQAANALMADALTAVPLSSVLLAGDVITRTELACLQANASMIISALMIRNV